MPASAGTRLRRKLQKIGGSDVLIVPDPYLEDIVERGELFVPAEILIVRGLPNRCHQNAALLWLRGRASEIVTGYYLAVDHVWHQHSWGTANSGILLDTHRGGQKYFGIRLDNMRAIAFAESNCGFQNVMRWMDKNPKRFEPIIQAAREILDS